MAKTPCVCGHEDRDHLHKKTMCRRIHCPCQSYRPVASDRYRVEYLVAETQRFVAYTSLKQPVTLAMAEALGRGLKRQGQAGRILEFGTDKIVEAWDRTVVTN
jgi:hypothetical protein